MSKRETYRNTLTYALAIAGSERELAARLVVSVPQIANWINGIDEIPDQVFLAIVDVVTSATAEEIRRSRSELGRQQH